MVAPGSLSIAAAAGESGASRHQSMKKMLPALLRRALLRPWCTSTCQIGLPASWPRVLLYVAISAGLWVSLPIDTAAAVTSASANGRSAVLDGALASALAWQRHSAPLCEGLWNAISPPLASNFPSRNRMRCRAFLLRTTTHGYVYA